MKTNQNASENITKESKKGALKNPPQKEKQKDTQSIELTQKEYFYDATGKPDPFEPLIAITMSVKQPQGATTQPQKPDKPLTPLQKYDLSDLFLVAIVDTDTGSTALIEDNARNGFIVKEGMIIGKNDGIIKKILKNSMVVEEKIPDSTGNIETKISTLTIYKKE